MKTYNFGAGPACLPTAVLEQIKADIPDWYNGMSVMELSHRLDKVLAMTKESESDLRSLLAIPEDYAVLFMQGGARGQFSAIPLNLLNGATTADYLISGHWSQLAFDEVKKYCNPHCVAKDIEHPRNFSDDAAYVHFTDNETIQGIEFPHFPKIKKGWLVSDMTSNILSKPINFENVGLIYASAQKNLGIAGITVVIVHKSLLGKAHPLTPSILNYDLYYQNDSMLNTPSVFCWYVLGLMLKWAIAQGGVEILAQKQQIKANLLYNMIDSTDFYTNPIAKEYRSRINIPFSLPSETLESRFLQEASEIGLRQLKGHKVAGGCRASIYNAMPLEGVEQLVSFMRDFCQRHG